MSLIDVDSWVTEHDSIERLHSSILSDIFQRNNKTKNTEYSIISANIRVKIQQFERDLSQLRQKLSISIQNRSITIEEIDRRQNEIKKFESNYKKIIQQFRNVEHRNVLIPPNQQSLWEDSDDDENIINSNSNCDPRAQQIEILENQNRGLEALSETLSRQKNLASKLGEEVEGQNEILDDLTDRMSIVDGRVNHATREIGVVTQKDSTCSYWVIIICLFIAICIVALV